MSDLIPKTPNALVDPQAQLLVQFLTDMGLPADNILAEQHQRQTIGSNLPAFIESVFRLTEGLFRVSV